MMNVAIMGYGTIGSGVAEILEANKDAIRQAAGQELSLRCVRSQGPFREPGRG